MANKKSWINDLPPLPNIVQLSPNQLPQGQANELMRDRQVIPQQVPQPIEQQFNITPLKAYNLLQMLGMPESYKMPAYQDDEYAIARAKQLKEALGSFQPTLDAMRQSENENFRREAYSQAIGATPVKKKTDLELQQDSLKALMDTYKAQKSLEQSGNTERQMRALSEAIGLPITNEEFFFKNIANPILSSQANLNNASIKEQLQQSSIKQHENLPSTQLENQLLRTQIDAQEKENMNPTKNLTEEQREGLSQYANMKAYEPYLLENADRLFELNQVANYTPWDMATDATKRTFGMPVSQGAVARAETIGLIDNTIIPSLRASLGAQFTEREGQWLRASMLDITKSPQEKDAILKTFIKNKLDNANKSIDALRIQGVDVDRILLDYQQSKTPKSNNADMIRVRKPSGETGRIPASQLEEALKEGYTRL